MNADAASSATTHLHDLARHKLTAAQVMAMVDAGIIAEDEPVEFLKGDLYPMAPQSPGHFNATWHLTLLLARRYPEPWVVAGQGPLACGADSLPEPDIMVLSSGACRAANRHPRGDEAILVVELATTSQRRDRFKAHIYAEAGVPEYWLLDLEARRLERYRQPLEAEARYAEVFILTADQTVELPVLGDILKVADLM